MPGREGQRAILSPPRHPGEDETRVALRAGLRAEAEPLGDARTEPLDEHVGVLGQLQQDVDSGRVLEIQANRPTATAERIAGLRCVWSGPFGTVHAEYVSTEIGQDHAAERGRGQAGNLDHAHAVQWAHGRLPHRFRARIADGLAAAPGLAR